jgi:hypothetical protein
VTETPLRSCAAAQATSMQHAARPKTPPNAFALLAEAAVSQRQLLTVVYFTPTTPTFIS